MELFKFEKSPKVRSKKGMEFDPTRRAITGGILLTIGKLLIGYKTNLFASSELSIYQIPDLSLEIKREKIPQKLPELIAKYGDVIEVPKNFQPENPILYLMATRHHMGKRAFNPTTNRIQEENVHVFHVLYKLGVHIQFLEGVTYGLKYDQNSTEFDENPLQALADYKKTGRIQRSYTTIEAIYKDLVESIGAEEDALKVYKEKQKFNQFNNEVFPLARFGILSDICNHVLEFASIPCLELLLSI